MRNDIYYQVDLRIRGSIGNNVGVPMFRLLQSHINDNVIDPVWNQCGNVTLQLDDQVTKILKASLK